MSTAAAVAAVVPVVAGGLVCAFVSFASTGGTAVVVWPWASMLIGLVAAWLVLFVILVLPTLAQLREGPGPHLRRQEP